MGEVVANEIFLRILGDTGAGKYIWIQNGVKLIPPDSGMVFLVSAGCFLLSFVLTLSFFRKAAKWK